nr:peptidylprolyl isomerase [Anaerohalosphaera lusitana]
MEKVSAKEDLGVSEEKAKEVYMNQPVQVQASHILIDTREKDEAAKAEAKKEIEAILADVKDGGDFAEIAKEKSDCPSGQRGGDLGFFTKEKMVPAFSNAAFAMEVGEVSDVVETQFGYHIIKVTDRKAPDASKFDEEKEQIMAQEEQKNKSQFAQTYIQNLAENAEIEWNEEYDPRQQMPQRPAQPVSKGGAQDK